MGLRINTNVASIGAQRNLSITNRRMNDSMRKLSSGQRITRAADDAAGLAISEKLKAQIRGIRQAKRNADDGISFIQTGEGALNEISSLIIRLRELSVQASSDTVGATERQFSNVEFQQLKDEIERISQSTEFNGFKLLDGTGGMVDFQVGIHNDARRDRISLDSSSFMADLGALGIVSDDISAKEGAQMSLSRLDDALVKINSMRSDYGALQNRLTSVTNTLAINDENLSAANSRIRDVDVAAETAELTRNNILVQAGTSVLSQANQSAQFALKLLG